MKFPLKEWLSLLKIIIGHKLNIEQIKDIKVNFILTTARTGSTLLSSMLNMHPNIISTIEEPFVYYLHPKYSKIKIWTSKTIQEYCNDFYLFSEGKLTLQFGTRKDLENILEKYKLYLSVELAIKLTYLCFFPDKDKSQITSVVDKQLKFHFCLERLSSFYPESKFIILYRDPRDNAYTKWRMFENKKQHNELNYYRISHVWKYVYGRLNELRNKIGSERFLEVKYEDLVSTPEAELKKICLFIEIPYTFEMLSYNEKIKSEISKKEINKLNEVSQRHIEMHNGLTQKVNTDKIGYWKEKLKPEEANLVWTICGELAEKIGYKRDKYFVPQKIKFSYFIENIKVKKIRILIALYHACPYFIWFWIKKVKQHK